MPSEPSQGDPGREAAPATRAGEAGALLRGLGAALSFLGGALPAQARAVADLSRGALFVPALGFALGLGVGAVAAVAMRHAPAVAIAPAVVAILLLVQRGVPAVAIAEVVARPHADGGAGRRMAAASALLALVFVAKSLAIALLGGAAVALGLAIAVMLGRWAVVVHVYGSLAAPGDDVAQGLVRGVQFREFAIASVSAMALALGIADAVGVVLVLAAATLAVAARIAAHRAYGGVSLRTALAGGEIAETGALFAAGLLARALAG